MNFRAKRIVSTLCALAMLAAMIPSTALADDTATAPASSAITAETPAPDVQEGPDVSIDAGNTDPAPEETPGEVPTPTPTETPEEEPIEEPDENPEESPAELPEETPSAPLAEEPTQGQEDTSAQAPQGNGSTVGVEEAYTITDETPNIQNVLNQAKAAGADAKICGGNYDGGFTVEGITLYVEGEVRLSKGITLKNATLQGVTGRDADKVIIESTSNEVTVNNATLNRVTLDITGCVFNYLLLWSSGDFVVNDSYLSASGNHSVDGKEAGSGMFVSPGTGTFTATNSELHFDNNVRSNGGAGIWSDGDGNQNVIFNFTNCTVTMNGNGLNGFMGAPAPFFGGNTPTPRFTFIDTNVEACNNGPSPAGGHGDGFSYGYITLIDTDKNDDQEHSFNVSGNSNNGLDGGKNNNAALNAEGYTILANDNGGIGINVSKLNTEESACTLKNCTVEANRNGSYGISLKQPAEITNTTITASNNSSHGIYASQTVTISSSSITTDENSNNGVYFLASNGNLTMDAASTLTANNNAKSGVYFYGGTGTLDGVLTANGNQNSGLYIYKGTFKVNNGASAIMSNQSNNKGGGVYNKGAVTLADGVKLYNNHADKAGDDLYNDANATAILHAVGSDWVLDDCLHTINGWYDDAETTRWNVDDGTKATYAKEFVIPSDSGNATVPASTALKAAHDLFEVKVQPAEITIYMGGDDGYEGVSTENGSLKGSNSLPEPGYYFDLPKDVNEAFQAIGLDQPTDLSKYIKVDYITPSDTRHWDLEKYGANASVANNKFIYRINGESDDKPFRLNFSHIDDEGKETIYTEDNFDLEAAGTLSYEYSMKIYDELTDEVIITITVPAVNGQPQKIFRCKMTPVDSKLHVRYVSGSQDSVVTGAVTDIKDASDQEDPNQKALKNAYVLPAADTIFYINDSKIDVTDEAAPSLLFDAIVSSEEAGTTVNYEKILTDKAVEKTGVTFTNLESQAHYLDLVDANNGNTWLKPSNNVTVYWPYPDGTDADTKFYLVHFDGVDRDMDIENIQDKIDASTLEVMDLTTDEYGIRFETDSFSPYVLLWEKEVPNQPEEGGSSEQPAPTATPAPTPAPSAQPVAAPVTTAAIPQTGDALPVVPLAATAVIAGAALAVLTFLRKRRSR